MKYLVIAIELLLAAINVPYALQGHIFNMIAVGFCISLFCISLACAIAFQRDEE